MGLWWPLLGPTQRGAVGILKPFNSLSGRRSGWMMIDWLLIFTRDLAFAVWLGGLIVIDCIETPARFRVKSIDRNQVAAVGWEVFAAVNRTETMLGALLIIVGALLAVRATTISHKLSLALVNLGAMWLVALWQNFWARPRMSAATKALDLVNRLPGDERFHLLRRWHKTYVALDLVKILLGLSVLGLWAWARESPARSFNVSRRRGKTWRQIRNLPAHIIPQLS
jgi:hypothetical protein